MRKAIALTIFQAFVSFSYSMAQPNCFIYQKDKNCYEACIEAERALQHPQGSKSSQQHLLNSIDLCPDFDYSYFEQSVPYAKRGLMHQWLGIINKAVELNPREYLGWRGWYHWLFMRNYEKAIADIDRLDSIMESDIGATGDGLYHLNIVKALCYKGIGDYNKAIELIENCINSKDYYKGSYDNLHLGVLYLEVKEPTKALVEFEKQVEYNEVSEAYFYTAKAYQLLGDLPTAKDFLNLALDKYDQGKEMNNPYRQLIDEIYRIDIEYELKYMTAKQ